VDVEHVDGQIVGRQVHRLEHLLEGHGLAALGLADGRVGLRLEGLLDEAEEVLLVHAGGGVNVGVHLQVGGLESVRILFLSTTGRQHGVVYSETSGAYTIKLFTAVIYGFS